MKDVKTTVPASGVPAILGREVSEDTCSVSLSETDATDVMATAENPPAANETALRAARRFLQQHG